MATITEAATLHRDPTVWKPPLFDREERWNYPSIVHNVLKEVMETHNSDAGNTVIPSAVFMSDRIVFEGTAAGTTKQLPTATDIVKYLESVYSQVIGRSIVNGLIDLKEIEVEFFNVAAGNVTLSTNTGISMFPNNLVIPQGSNAKYKFLIFQTTPTPTISAYLVPGVAGYATTLLPISPQAPTQLVDYNPSTNTYGYVTDANLSSTVDANTLIMGWDPVTSTIRKYVLTAGTTVSGAPLQLNTDGTLALRVSTPPLMQRSTGQVVPTGGPTLVTFDTNVGAATTDCTYAAGIFTTQTNNAYHVNINILQTAIAANCYYQLVYGAVVGSGTVIAVSGPTDDSRVVTINAYLHMASLGGNTPPYQFHVECVNTSGGNVTIVSGIQSQIIVGYVRV